jgi:spectinomycin phosphotransferase
MMIMLEKPNLTDDVIIASLRENYGIPIQQLEFLPLGQDSNAWVYKATGDDGTAYFLKVRRGSINQHSLTIPRYFKDNGIQLVIAPYAADTQALWQQIDDFKLILYPFLTGKDGIEANMTRAQWIEYGRLLRQIHQTHLPPQTTRGVRGETFTSAREADVQRLDIAMDTVTIQDDVQRELVAFWQSKRAEIRHFGATVRRMESHLYDYQFSPCICHADCHPYNLLMTPDGKLWLVDWDEVMAAPFERDLMFIGSGIGGDANGAQQEAWFYEGYGTLDHGFSDRGLIAYYRYEWVLQDIADFAHRVLSDDSGADTKAEALTLFKGLFAPASTVERALQTRIPDWLL